MSSHELTEGAIEAIMSGKEIKNPVVQVLGSKAIPGQANSERYRLLISDGKHLNSFAMLATQLTPVLKSGQLSEYTIVKITNHVVSMIKNTGKSDKRIMVILEVDILVPGCEINRRLGNPIPLAECKTENGTANGTAPAAAPTTPSQKLKPDFDPPAKRLCTNNNRLNDTTLNSPMNKSRTHPIASLSPYQNGWTIKARITSKSDIRTWSNARGEGKLFSVDLVDETGEIRATAFKEQCDKYFDMLEVNKVYYISRGSLKMANKQYSSLKNEYELTFNSETKIAPCEDDASSIPKIQFNFQPLSAIQEAAANQMIDIIGVAKTAGDVVQLTSRTTNRELKKRDVTLVDQSHVSVSLTLWGNSAEEFSADGTPVVAVKGARVGEYMGNKQLSLVGSSTLQINPDIPEAFRLRGWFDMLSPDTKFTSISQTSGDGGAGGASNTMLIGEALAAKLGCGDKADYFSTHATLMFIKSERCVYKACPTSDCQKKVIDQNNGLFRCEKCNKEFDSFKYRLMVSASVGDFSGNQWVTLFQDAAEELLGTSAEEIGRLHDNEDPQLNNVFQKITLYPFTFKLRAKMDTYNDESRLKMTVVNVKKPDMKERCKKLMAEIKEMSGIGTAH